MRKSARGSGIYLLFFLSGAAGLVYEVVWSRLLKDVFGVTAHAVAAVLATFLGGLALGSWALGRYADRYDRLADGVAAALDLEALGRIARCPIGAVTT